MTTEQGKTPKAVPGIADAPKAAGTASFWATLQAVLWSFFGVRRSDHHDADMKTLNPVHVIIVGILAAVMFVFTLIGIVKMVVP